MEDVKDKVKYHYDELEEYSGKWTILFFGIDGSTYHSSKIYDTKDEAVKRIFFLFNMFRKSYIKFIRYSPPKRVLVNKLSYAIPMPIGKK